MKKRGKILRDTSAGPGLVMAEGQQYTFSLEGMWRSPEAPRVGMVTDVEFDDDSSVRTLTLVPESQLAKEQAEAVMAAARELGSALVGQSYWAREFESVGRCTHRFRAWQRRQMFRHRRLIGDDHSRTNVRR